MPGGRPCGRGVDVVGDACHLVVIDRFRSTPGRSRLAPARWTSGAGGWLRRCPSRDGSGCVGRLLRSTDDRGVVAILDPRVVTKRYGGFIMRSCPVATTDPQVVRGAHGASRVLTSRDRRSSGG